MAVASDIVISIHASAKEATKSVLQVPVTFGISIHASAKEATKAPLFAPVSSRISIHASAKEATNHFCQLLCADKISIHASAKEATKYGLLTVLDYDKFQSTPPRRRRPVSSKILALTYRFQSTPPRRRRRCRQCRKCLVSHNFNPRLREGGDGCLVL